MACMNFRRTSSAFGCPMSEAAGERRAGIIAADRRAAATDAAAKASFWKVVMMTKSLLQRFANPLRIECLQRFGLNLPGQLAVTGFAKDGDDANNFFREYAVVRLASGFTLVLPGVFHPALVILNGGCEPFPGVTQVFFGEPVFLQVHQSLVRHIVNP